METRLTFIVNPAARTCPPNIGALIGKHLPQAVILETRGPGDACARAREALAENRGPDDIIVACGGDGTFREVAQAVGMKARLAILPLGTVNQISLQLGIPSRLERALEILEKPSTAPLYPGLCRFDDEAETHYFFIGVSAGPDADAVALVNPRLKRVAGSLAYAEAFLRRLVKPVHRVIACTLERQGDAETLYASEAIALANGVYGMKFRFSGTLRPGTPGVELALARGGRWGVTAFFLRALLPFPCAPTRPLGDGTLTLSRPLRGEFQIDGDRVTAERAAIKFSTEPLRVCVPEGKPS